MTAAARPAVVVPLSARAELLVVVRAAMAVAVGVWIYVASTASTLGGGAGQRNLLPFQKLIADRPADEQRTFRELQEGLLEIEAARSASNAWPTTDSLSADGVPPFAPDPTRHSPATWQRLQSGTTINYLGVPAHADGPAWLLLVLEPEPGVPPDQNFEDEEHHRLADGAMLHVSTWVHQDGRKISARVVRLPQAEGWTQLYAVGPASAGPAIGNR
ncbi:MAG TPA: hypothetical protein VF219_05560 [Vicinamibacterales bacterium]